MKDSAGYSYNRYAEDPKFQAVSFFAFGPLTLDSGLHYPTMTLELSTGSASSSVRVTDFDGALAKGLRSLADDVEKHWAEYIDHVHAQALIEDEVRNTKTIRECRAIA